MKKGSEGEREKQKILMYRENVRGMIFSHHIMTDNRIKLCIQYIPVGSISHPLITGDMYIYIFEHHRYGYDYKTIIIDAFAV